MKEIKFADGIFYNEKRIQTDKYDFTAKSISIQKDKFMEFIQGLDTNDKGYIRFNVKQKRTGDGFYVSIDDYEPKEATTKQPGYEEDIPF